MNRADEIRAKGAMLAGGPAQPVQAPRTDPFRLSVDLAPKDHDQLQQWVTTAGAELGRRIPAARVMRVLLWRMLSDETLQREITEELRKPG